MIGTDSKRESEKSVLAAQHDDDDDIISEYEGVCDVMVTIIGNGQDDPSSNLAYSVGSVEYINCFSAER